MEVSLREKLYDMEAAQRISRINRMLKEHGQALECYNKVPYLLVRSVVEPAGAGLFSWSRSR